MAWFFLALFAAGAIGFSLLAFTASDMLVFLCRCGFAAVCALLTIGCAIGMSL